MTNKHVKRRRQVAYTWARAVYLDYARECWYYTLIDWPMPGDWSRSDLLLYPEKYQHPPVALYRSWDEYLARAVVKDILAMCKRRANKANTRARKTQDTGRITDADVWRVLNSALGRCYYCDSLAVESRPATDVNASVVSRRIGTVEHLTRLADGGRNALDNLAWACLHCNTCGTDRFPGATNHGAIHPQISSQWNELEVTQ